MKFVQVINKGKFDRKKHGGKEGLQTVNEVKGTKKSSTSYYTVYALTMVIIRL